MNLSNGVEPADQSQPTATNSLIARNRSHTRKRAQGHHISRGLDCRARPCQHLTLIPFLVSLTAPAVRYSETILSVVVASLNLPSHCALSALCRVVVAQWRLVSDYSARSVIAGSTRAARQAGTQHAIPDTASSRAITPR
jgi:hypothetical protein